MTSYVLGAVLLVGTAGYWLARAHRWLAGVWFLGVAWRLLSGHRQDGKPGRMRRAAWRSGGVLAVVVLVAGWLASPQVTGWALILCFTVSVMVVTWRAWRLLAGWRHHRVWLRPLHLAAHEVAQIDRRRRPGEWLAVEPDRSRAVLALPSGWPADATDKPRLGAMAAAANYGRANRQVLASTVRHIFSQTPGGSLDLVYDISHNLAKIETHLVEGKTVSLCVHRKGATRTLPPVHPDLPADLREVGQPVLIPGSMGTCSYVLVGIPGGGAFASTCHGAGRVMSRHQALREVSGPELQRRLQARGIEVRGASSRGLAEETPEAYKDVTEVVAAAEGAGLCRKVARLVPLGVVKG